MSHPLLCKTSQEIDGQEANPLGVNTFAFCELENILTHTWCNDHPTTDLHSSKWQDFGETVFLHSFISDNPVLPGLFIENRSG